MQVDRVNQCMSPRCGKTKHLRYFQHFLVLTRDSCPYIQVCFGQHDCDVQPSGSHSIPWSRRMGRRFSLESLAIFLLTQNKLHTGRCADPLSEKVDGQNFCTQYRTERQYLDCQAGSSGIVGWQIDRVCLLLHHHESNDYLQLILHRLTQFQVC